MKKTLLLIVLIGSMLLGCSNTENSKSELLNSKVEIKASKTEYRDCKLLYRNTKIDIGDFYISAYKIKQKEWNFYFPEKKVKGDDKAPVIVKNIKDIQEFCNRKSLAEGYIPVYENGKINPRANGYRLPTQEEIFYAYIYKETGISYAEGKSANYYLGDEDFGKESIDPKTLGINCGTSIADSISNKEYFRTEFKDDFKEEFFAIKEINQGKIKKRAIKEKTFDLYTGLYSGIEEYRTIKDGGLDEVYEGTTNFTYFNFRIARNLGIENEYCYSLDKMIDTYSIYKDEINGINIAYPEGWGITKFTNSSIKIRNSIKKTDPTSIDYKGNLYFLPLYNGKGALYKYGYFVYQYTVKKDETVENIAAKLWKEIGAKEPFFNFFKENDKYYFMLKKEEKNEEICFILKNNKLYELSFSTYNGKTVFPEELKKILIDKIYIE
jgi:hypothetical protein